MREDIWVDELTFRSYQNNEIDFIDDSGKSCCVQSLSDHDKQVRKEVVQEIRSKIEQAKLIYEWKGEETTIEDILAKIEKGEI